MASVSGAAAASAKKLVAIVTGGASGLGKATVKYLTGKGYNVGLFDLPSSEGSKLAEEIGSGIVQFRPLDVSSEDQVKEAVDSIAGQFGQLNLVVNCAGVAFAQKLYSTTKADFMKRDRIDKIIKVNLYGTINVIQYSLPHLIASTPDENNQRGLVINTSSIAAFEGQAGQALYAATKGAIASMTLPLARDYAVPGIRFVTIAPGLFETPLMDSLPDKAKKFLGKLVLSPQRLGYPEEFAALVGHIVENPYINGEVIRLDGGLRMSP
uniref:3-hydroxyacyl-CoA dehydrogenase type-2 n=1 Tax=Meloidogyne incognita TaxID=6306 RepID=A0A914LEW1_MELIC